MTRQLHNTGEEYIIDKLNGESFTVSLYNDSTDNLGDSDDISNIGTEPSGGSFSRQSSTFSVTDNASGNWQIDNDNQLTYDTSDSSQTVDSYFIIVNFQSDDTNDSSANDHLLVTGALDQSLDLSNFSQVAIDAGEAGVALD